MKASARRLAVDTVLLAAVSCAAVFVIGAPVRSLFATEDMGRPGDWLGDPDIVVRSRLLSPDGSKVVIVYDRDIGALGFGYGGSALLPADSTDQDLRRTRPPWSYTPTQWEPDGSLTVKVDYIYCLHHHLSCEGGRRTFFNTPINVVLDDGTGARPVVVEDRLTSPDGKLDLVAYRYPEPGYLHRIHISIVPAGARVPRYGNYFIGHYSGDGLLGGHWTAPRRITFFTSEAQEPFSRYGFIDNPWAVRHAVVVIPTWAMRYLWGRP